MDCSLPGSSVHGILQARILEGLPFPTPGDLPNPGVELGSPELQASSLPSEPLVVEQSGLGSPVCVHLHPLPDGFLSASLLFFPFSNQPWSLFFFFVAGGGGEA